MNPAKDISSGGQQYTQEQQLQAALMVLGASVSAVQQSIRLQLIFAAQHAQIQQLQRQVQELTQDLQNRNQQVEVMQQAADMIAENPLAAPPIDPNILGNARELLRDRANHITVGQFVRSAILTLIIAGMVFAAIYLAKKGIDMVLNGEGGEYFWRSRLWSEAYQPAMFIGGAVGLITPIIYGTVKTIKNPKVLDSNEEFFWHVVKIMGLALVHGVIGSLMSSVKGGAIAWGSIFAISSPISIGYGACHRDDDD